MESFILPHPFEYFIRPLCSPLREWLVIRVIPGMCGPCSRSRTASAFNSYYCTTQLCACKRKCGKPKKPNEKEKQTDSTQPGCKQWVQSNTKPNATWKESQQIVVSLVQSLIAYVLIKLFDLQYIFLWHLVLTANQKIILILLWLWLIQFGEICVTAISGISNNR